MIPSSRLTRFLLTAGLLYAAWYFLYYFTIHSSTSLSSEADRALCRHIASASSAVLRTFGYDSFARSALLFVNGWHVVSVGWQCDGLSVMALFTVFIIAYPGPWRTKLWFIPMGIAAIHLINILRVVALALNQIYSHGTTDFNHHYTYTIVVYGFIFWLWTIWVRRFSGRVPGASTDAAPATTTSATTPSVNG